MLTRGLFHFLSPSAFQISTQHLFSFVWSSTFMGSQPSPLQTNGIPPLNLGQQSPYLYCLTRWCFQWHSLPQGGFQNFRLLWLTLLSWCSIKTRFPLSPTLSLCQRYCHLCIWTKLFISWCFPQSPILLKLKKNFTHQTFTELWHSTWTVLGPSQPLPGFLLAYTESIKGLSVSIQHLSHWISDCMKLCYNLAKVSPPLRIMAHSTRAQFFRTMFQYLIEAREPRGHLCIAFPLIIPSLKPLMTMPTLASQCYNFCSEDQMSHTRELLMSYPQCNMCPVPQRIKEW